MAYDCLLICLIGSLCLYKATSSEFILVINAFYLCFYLTAVFNYTILAVILSTRFSSERMLAAYNGYDDSIKVNFYVIERYIWPPIVQAQPFDMQAFLHAQIPPVP